MRRYGLYDVTRGLTLALAAGVAGLLLWVATQVGQQSTGRFWAEMGIVAGAGLVMALAPVLGGWSSGLRLRFSPGTFLLGFIPVLIVTGWILMATQPGSGWHEGTLVRWSHDIGLMGVIHAVGLWHGVLAFGLGLTLGYVLDAVPAPVAAPAAEPVPMAAGAMAGSRDRTMVEEPATAQRSAAYGRDGRPVEDQPATAQQSVPWYRRWRRQPTTTTSSTGPADADAPTSAEDREASQREAAYNAEPPTVTVGRSHPEE